MESWSAFAGARHPTGRQHRVAAGHADTQQGACAAFSASADGNVYHWHLVDSS